MEITSKPTAVEDAGLLKDAAQEKAWEILAQRDALWATCTSGKRKVRWDLADFMNTGHREVAWSLTHARAIGILANRVESIVDFGCGPGRLSGALGEVAENVTCVDPSPTMLNLARSHHSGSQFNFSANLDNVPESSADLVYSTFVLRHLSDAGRRRAISDVARILRPGSLFVFQFPQKPRRTLGGITWSVLPLSALMFIQRRILRFPEAMPMRWANIEDIKTELQQAGFELKDTATGLLYSPDWVDVWYYAVKGADSNDTDLRVQ